MSSTDLNAFIPTDIHVNRRRSKICFGCHIRHPEIRKFPQNFPEHALTLPCGDALSSAPADVQVGLFFRGDGKGGKGGALGGAQFVV
jgi:hypothetical protein